MDKFPEAFNRFEETVDIDQIQGMRHLKLVFAHWMGKGWKDSSKQNTALKIEAERYGIVEARYPTPKVEKPKRIPKEMLRRMPPSMLVTEKPVYTATALWWRREVVTVKGRSQTVYRSVKSGRFIRKP